MDIDRMFYIPTYGMPENLASPSCSKNRPTMYSGGFWEKTSFLELLRYPLPLLEFQLIAIFIVYAVLYLLFKRFKVPAMVIEVLVGIIIGHFLRKNQDLFKLMMHEDAETVINTLGSMGLLLHTFIIGVKIDPSIIKKSGRRAWVLGTLPYLLTKSAALLSIKNYFNVRWPDLSGLFLNVAVIDTGISFPVIAILLNDLKILNSELGRLALSSSLISFFWNTIAEGGLALFRLMALMSVRVAIKSLILLVCFLFICVFVIRPAMFWIVKRTPEGKPVSEAYVTSITALVLACAMFSENSGFEYRYMPVFVGLIMPDGPPLGSTLEKRLGILSGWGLRLLMIYGGFITSLPDLDRNHAIAICGIIILCIVLKLVITFLLGFFSKMLRREALALAFIFAIKGFYDLFLYITNSQRQVMTDAQYTVLVISLLVNATIVPHVVSRLYDPSKKYAGYQNRSVLHTHTNAELHLLACVHRRDDALGVIKILEAFNPTPKSPLSVHGLLLMELVGRATPLRIDHQLGQQAYFSSRAQHIIDIFNHYKQQNFESVNLQVFSAISPRKLMHEDICSIAFDKLASFVILPFHRKWNNKGKMILDDTTLRTINCRVLETAPCSVGILIDRRKICGLAPMMSMKALYCVAVLFLGGEDDREALALGKRMAECPQVHVTVLHLIPLHGACDDSGGGVLDVQDWGERRIESSQIGNVIYKEEIVREGSDTAAIIRSIESKFDLMILGRRHKADTPLTSGFTEWSEFPELGPVGDLLASSDIQSAVSALVVQQQQQELQCN